MKLPAPSRTMIAFASCTIAFLALDAAWLASTGSRIYRPAIGHLMRPDPDFLAASLFYAVYVSGLIIFAVLPSTHTRDAAVRGAAFGLVAYATYDLTCQATMAGWPWTLTIMDLAWGAFASAAACAVAKAISSRIRS